jgi:hypothetical protein
MTAVFCFASIVYLFGACARIQVAQGYSGQVVDASNRAGLSNVAIQVSVMRTSSFDGTKLLHTYNYKTNERGQFLLPARKKLVESVPEQQEEMVYFEMIRFAKQGYESLEIRTDEHPGAVALTDPSARNLVIPLKPINPRDKK